MVTKKDTASENDVAEVPVGKYFGKVRENPWIASTFVLGLLLLGVLIFGGSSGGSVSADEAGAKVIQFINSNPQITGEVALDSVEDDGQFYQVMLSYEGQQVPVYATKDAKFLVSSPVALDTDLSAGSSDGQQTATEVPTSDVPEVELFIWSYCPYGVQAQGPLADVAMLLGQDANFEAVLYYDGHGDYETQQNMIQACIQELDKDKYWAYAKKFTEEIYPNCGASRDIECDRTESINLMNTLGIDSSAVMSCVETQGAELIAEDSQRASELGVTGSPTLIVNGVKANVARNAEAFKTAVCGAFNEAPEDCSEVLSSDAGATTAAAQC